MGDVSRGSPAARPRGTRAEVAKEWEEVLVVLDEVTVVRLDDRRCSTSCSKETGQMLKRAKEATWAGLGGSGLLEMFNILQFQ